MFSLNGTLKKSRSVGRWETKQIFYLDGLSERRAALTLMPTISDQSTNHLNSL